MIDSLRSTLLGLPRHHKRMLQVATDVVLIWLALWLAFVVRLGFDGPIDPFGDHFWLFAVAPLVSIPIFIRLGMYRAVMRYFGNDALLAIFKAVTLSVLLLALLLYLYREAPVVVPRSLVFNYWWLSLMLIGGLRLAMRQYFLGDWYVASQQFPFITGRQEDGLRKVAIYGAGGAGNQLVAALRSGRVMRPVAFVDDDESLAYRVIAGLLVYKPAHIQRMIERTGAQEILLAIPSASRARRREILEMLEDTPLHVRTVPDVSELASGRVRVDDIQEVDIADLLGRDAVPPQQALLERCIRGRSVMITGAGGSIGGELCRQILGCAPEVLLLLDHSEFNLYSIHADLIRRVEREGLAIRLIPVLGSVRNPGRLHELMHTWQVNTVYHAAAYKHVPIVEQNIAEGVLNNVIGTLHTAQSAVRAGVENFVLVSTDKAVRPANVMGCTKRLAEMLLQALSREPAPVMFDDRDGLHRVNKTRFTMVRFGNVLGSSGSVIPRFQEQILRGGPVTVTHPGITRYFMTIPEAAQLVIQAGAMGQGGDVFVLDMGRPVRIVELAERMIRLCGLRVRSEKNPHGDIAIEFTGLRPGEKLYEELLIGDNVSSTEHPMIMRANEEHLSWDALKSVLEALLQAIEGDDYVRVRELLHGAVSGYAPEGDIVDWIHLRRASKFQDPEL
ncbi:polysaccharide biosynthesis protein [Zestomonas carbonaria]|uniref:UDP-N-acetyl-alpha-D-glucosamine C6 dehydratase n=1 Tax=Zestomonas carbonaria TaxID=2762745 RepID=A0A7U7ERG3_9GAMM|nr:nucleoside-diphosphate sugar epimerase/dehydratase [Pseudomonas carbonaria]CAD5109725.1 UDP-N-acetyl-alpha-D-glucosamine C6 dehydratase [Pseudomonas carbonaria]